jgi:hypothetical protein
MPKPSTANSLGRLHTQNPSDAAWRAQQAQVDADFEGLSRDTEADGLVAEMDASGVGIREQISRLKTYFRRR